ncbi:MAG: SpoIIE family protein phosphatase [Planctomycetaceae bacterium]|nr:SpoIIE family protein phosphatase [Planctomycetaceae bacterium]
MVALIEMRRQRNHDIHYTEQLKEEAAKRRAEQIDSELARISANLRVLKDYIEAHPDATTDELHWFFSRYVRGNPQLLGIFIAYDPEHNINRKDKILNVYREEGTIKTHMLGGEYDYSRDIYLIPKLTKMQFWSEPYINIEPAKQFICTFSVPFFFDDKFAGCLVADISLEKIRQFVQSNLPDNSQFAVISPKGSIISDSDPELEMNETIFSLAEWYERGELAQWGYQLLRGDDTRIRLAAVNNSQPEKMIWNNKEPVWIIPARIKETNWTLIVATNENVILQPTYERLKQRVYIFIVVLLVIIAIVCFASLRLNTELKYLTDFASELAKGNLNAKVKGKHSEDEFGHLADTFDKMSTELKASINRLVLETEARKTIEGELQAARKIQLSLLPRTFPAFPDRAEFDLYAKNEPATFIAGDFYDFFFINENTIAFTIADVSGHGIPAALFMAVSRTAIRNSAARNNCAVRNNCDIKNNSAKEIMSSVDSLLMSNNDDCMFVTAFFGMYDVSTGELCYVNAGHNPPYVLRSDGSITSLPATGPIMAVVDDAQYDENCIVLAPNDVIVTFTDGVTEAHMRNSSANWKKSKDGLFGEQRLEELIQEVHTGTAKEITDAIFAAVTEHDCGEHQDDITVLVLKRNPV